MKPVDVPEGGIAVHSLGSVPACGHVGEDDGVRMISKGDNALLHRSKRARDVTAAGLPTRIP